MFYRIGNLTVRSPFSIRKPKTGEDALILKTSRSFPPAHPSTKAALTVLHSLEIKKGSRILDIGCGSGVLGLAAALKNGAATLGCDISFAAVNASRQNAMLNRMENRFHLFQGSVEAVSGNFDVILANLHSTIQTEMFDHYRRLLPSKGNLLVIAGFYDVQAEEIKKEITRRGFDLLESAQVHAWAAAIPPDGSYTWAGFGFRKL